MKSPSPSIHTLIASLLLSLLACNMATAQEKNELLSKLAKNPHADTNRVKLLYELAMQYVQANLDSTELYAKEGLSIAEKEHFDAGTARCSKLLGIVGTRKHEYDKALQHFSKALGIFEKQRDKTMQADIHVYMGDIYYRDAKYNLAFEHYNTAVVMDEETGDLKTQGLALIDIGGIYTDQGSYPEAIKYYLKGLKVFEKQGDSAGVSMTMVNIANIYANMGKYNQALEYVNKSLPITKTVSDKEVVFSNMVNIGVIYGQMKDFKSALAAFNNGMLLADSLADQSWHVACLSNIADMYYQMGEYDTSLAKYTALLKQNEGLKDTTFIITAKTGVGNNLVKKGKLREGIEVLLDALQLARLKQLKQTIFDISQSLSDAYERLRDYASALKYHKIYFDYRDTLNNEKNERHIQQLQFDYELSKKEAQIELLNKNRIIAQDRSDRQRIVIWASLSGLALVIVICILLYRSSQREKSNKEKIEQQAKRLAELNKFKDKTFSVISHDLRSPVGALTATMAMLDRNIITLDEFMELKPEVQNQLASLNILLDNLLNWSKGYMQGEYSESREPVDMYEMAASNIALQEDAAGKKKLKLKNDIPTASNALCNRGQMDIVIRNLLMNAIKFSKNDGSITFSCSQDGNRMKVGITDEGVGMTQEQVNKLFSAAGSSSTFGTGGEKGIGIGLLLCYDFVKANNGTISVASEVNKGTTFTIDLPVAV